MIKLSCLFFRFRFIFPLPLYALCIIYASYDKTNFYAGILLILSGMALRFYAAGFIGVLSRSLSGPSADQLVTSGPYRQVRNPLYLSNILIYSGFTVLSNVFFPYFAVFTVLYFTGVYAVMILSEEDFLKNKYGDVYQRYLTETPAWIPRFRKSLLGTNGDIQFDVRRALRSERSTWSTFIAALTGILARLFA